MRFLYLRFDPRPRQNTIWKIAPGERGRLWEECRDGAVIRVGWDELGDLGQYQSDTELKQALDARWPRSSGGSLTLARRLLAFRDLEPGTGSSPTAERTRSSRPAPSTGATASNPTILNTGTSFR